MYFFDSGYRVIVCFFGWPFFFLQKEQKGDLEWGHEEDRQIDKQTEIREETRGRIEAK